MHWFLRLRNSAPFRTSLRAVLESSGVIEPVWFIPPPPQDTEEGILEEAFVFSTEDDNRGLARATRAFALYEDGKLILTFCATGVGNRHEFGLHRVQISVMFIDDEFIADSGFLTGESKTIDEIEDLISKFTYDFLEDGKSEQFFPQA